MMLSENTRGKSSYIIFAQIALIAILGFIVYFNSLHGKFIWDDYCYVKDNSYITSFSYLPKIFSSSVGEGAGVPSFFYRPIQMLSYLFDYSLWGYNVFGYHLMNILLHILASLCVYWMISVIFKERALAFLTSIFYVVYPAHVEAVASISGRADSLAAIFMLSSIVFYIKQSDSRGRFLFIACLFSYICALLSKESAIIMPVLLALYFYTFKMRVNRSLFSSLLAVAFGYIVLRLFIMNSLLTESLLPFTPTFGVFLKRVPLFLASIFYYLRILILPIDLRVDYGRRMFVFSDPQTILGLVVLVILAVYAFRIKNKNKIVFFALFWFFIALLPSANILKVNDSFIKEHWLYMPSIGFFLILGNSILKVYKNPRSKIVAIASASIIVLAYSFLTIRQNIYWSDPFIFMKRSLSFSNNYLFYNELGREYGNLNKIEEAADCYRKAIAMNPRQYFLYNNLYKTYNSSGRYKEAIIVCQEALKIFPQEKIIYYELGELFDKTGDRQAAIRYYSMAIDHDKKYLEAYNNLAAIYADMGQVDKAIEIWNKAIAINPSFAVAHFNLSVFYFGQKKYDLALWHCEKVRRLGYQVDDKFLKLLAPYRQQMQRKAIND